MTDADIAMIEMLTEKHAPSNDGIREFEYAGKLNGRHYWWGGGYKMLGPELVITELAKWGADPKILGEISSRIPKESVLY